MRLFACLKFLFFFFLLLLCSCEKNDKAEGCNCVKAEDSNNKTYQQFSFTLSIQNDTYGFVTVEKIDSIKLKIDGISYGPFSSELIDTIGKIDLINDNLPFSLSKREYLFYMSTKPDTTNTHILNEYVRLLGNSPVLTPGDHICEILEILFRKLDRDWIKINPQFYKVINISASSEIQFIGAFDILYHE